MSDVPASTPTCSCKCGHVAPGPWHAPGSCSMYRGALDLPVDQPTGSRSCSGPNAEVVPNGTEPDEHSTPTPDEAIGTSEAPDYTFVVEYGTSPEAEAIRVLRRAMCAPFGRGLVMHGLLRPFRMDDELRAEGERAATKRENKRIETMMRQRAGELRFIGHEDEADALDLMAKWITGDCSTCDEQHRRDLRPGVTCGECLRVGAKIREGASDAG